MKMTLGKDAIARALSTHPPTGRIVFVKTVNEISTPHHHGLARQGAIPVVALRNHCPVARGVARTERLEDQTHVYSTSAFHAHNRPLKLPREGQEPPVPFVVALQKESLNLPHIRKARRTGPKDDAFQLDGPEGAPTHCQLQIDGTRRHASASSGVESW